MSWIQTGALCSSVAFLHPFVFILFESQFNLEIWPVLSLVDVTCHFLALLLWLWLHSDDQEAAVWY